MVSATNEPSPVKMDRSPGAQNLLIGLHQSVGGMGSRWSRAAVTTQCVNFEFGPRQLSRVWSSIDDDAAALEKMVMSL